MKEACLNGFALLYVHLDLNINFKRVIDKLPRKNRRLNFNSVKFGHIVSVKFFGSPITTTNKFVLINALRAVA